MRMEWVGSDAACGEESVVDGVGDEFGGIACVEFAEQMAPVSLDGVGTESHTDGYIVGLAAGCDKAENLEFLRGRHLIGIHELP